MIIIVRREPDRSVSVRLERPDDPVPPEIHVAADVSAGESSFALFDSGAAVQQVDADYLVSIDWLRRQAFERGAAAWGPDFEQRLRGELDGYRYVEAMDALRVAVVAAGDEPVEPTVR